MPSKSSRSVPFSQSSRSLAPNSAAPSIAVGSPASGLSPPGSAARSDSRSPARSAGRQPLGERLEARRRLFLGLEERVLLEHLLDFLVQLERRQLEQPDRLLQLRRQREMLREADL